MLCACVCLSTPAVCLISANIIIHDNQAAHVASIKLHTLRGAIFRLGHSASQAMATEWLPQVLLLK